MINLTEHQIQILCLLSEYSDNRTTREYLAKATGLCDRVIRRNIQILRHKRYWILSGAEKAGYWITKDVGEWNNFVEKWNRSNRFNMLKKSYDNPKQHKIHGYRLELSEREEA